MRCSSKAQAAGPASRESGAQKIQPWDLQSSNKLTADQAATLTTIHESLARRLSSSIGVHLRVDFEMNLVTVEQLTYLKFLGRLPDLTYFCSMHLMQIDARSAIQMDVGLAYPIIDVVLGGTGNEPMDIRDLTEIEEQILESVIRLMLLDIHAVWAPVLDLDFRFEQRQRNVEDRKSTRLNSSHSQISYAVFCLKKKIMNDAHSRESATCSGCACELLWRALRCVWLLRGG